MKPYKTIVTAILLCAIMAPVVVQVTGFIKLSRLHYTYENRLRHQQLHTICLHEDDIVWAKPGKEIWYQGRMFDIKETRRENGLVMMKGFYDDEEKAMKQMMAREAKDDKQAVQNIAQLFITGLYVPPVQNSLVCAVAAMPVHPVNTGYIASLYKSFHTQLPAPPPRPSFC